MITPIGLNTTKKNNQTTFTSRAEIAISEAFLSRLEKSNSSDLISKKIAQGIQFLKDSAPIIGEKNAVLKLTDTPPADRMFFKDNKGLILSYNDDFCRTVDINNPVLSIKETLMNLTGELLSGKVQTIKGLKPESGIEQIKTLNTIV